MTITQEKPLVEFKEVKSGTYYSETQFYEFLRKEGNNAIFKTDKGVEVSLSASYIESCLVSAHSYSKEEKVSRTELINIIMKNPWTIMSVHFYKQVKEADVKEQIYALYPNKGKMLSEADFKKNVNSIIKGALQGEERLIVGRHQNTYDDRGRLFMVDMTLEKDENKESDSRMRLVDLRTVDEAIVRGTKYTQK